MGSERVRALIMFCRALFPPPAEKSKLLRSQQPTPGCPPGHTRGEFQRHGRNSFPAMLFARTSMRPKIVLRILASGVLLIACLMGLRAKYDGQEAQFLSDGGTSNAVEAGASQGKAAFAAHQKVVAGLPARSAQ